MMLVVLVVLVVKGSVELIEEAKSRRCATKAAKRDPKSTPP